MNDGRLLVCIHVSVCLLIMFNFRYISSSSSCNTWRTLSTITIYNPDGTILIQLHNSSDDIGSLNNVDDVGSVEVSGPAIWILFAAVNYGEPRTLVDNTIARSENISRVISEASSSIRRVGMECVDRPVGRCHTSITWVDVSIALTC